MPETRLCFFREVGDAVPVLDWLRVLRDRRPRVFAKCVARIRRLAEWGHELRRPNADYLSDGIHELRIRRGCVQYRILYFFHGRNAAVLVHALRKEGRIPRVDLDRARFRRRAFEDDPEARTHEEEVADG